MRPKTYWHILTKTFSSPAYYLELIQAPLWLSVRFFLISIILLSISQAIKISRVIIPQLETASIMMLDELEKNYPPNLEITWTKNKIELNPSKILTISYPTNFTNRAQLPARLAYLVPEEITPAQLTEKLEESSLFVLTPTQFYLNNLQGAWSVASLTDLLPTGNFIISQENLPNYLEQAKSFVSKSAQAAKQLAYLLTPLGMSLQLFWLGLIESIFILLLFKLNKIKLGFKKIYQLTLHVLIIAATIVQTTSWLYPQMQLPMLEFSFWIIFFYIFWTQKKNFSSLEKST